MDWRHFRQLGFKFDPTKIQLISVYLYPKVGGWMWPCDWIRDSNEVYTKPPSELCTDLTDFSGDGKYYFFTELKKNKNRVARTVDHYGTWHGSNRKEIFEPNNATIGFNRSFNFKKGEETTDWLMQEFSLAENATNLVLCVIQKKKKKKKEEEEMGSTYDTYPEFGPMDWWRVLELGFKFDPTEVQLITVYLYPKVRGERGPCDLIGNSNEVYTKPPWELCADLTAFPGDGKYYFFTELKKNKNRVARAVDSYGTWHGSNRKEIFEPNNGTIGFNRSFNFKKGEETTDWLMREFSLAENATNLVLCVIQKKKKEERGSVDPMSFLDLSSTTSAGGYPCPAPAPAHDDPVELQALDLEEVVTRTSKEMRSDPKFYDDPLSSGYPCPAPAPAPAHDNHLELQVLDSEEGETRPSKKMRSGPKVDDHPVSVASRSVDLPLDCWVNYEHILDNLPNLSDGESGLLDLSGLSDDVSSIPVDISGYFSLS